MVQSFLRKSSLMWGDALCGFLINIRLISHLSTFHVLSGLPPHRQQPLLSSPCSKVIHTSVGISNLTYMFVQNGPTLEVITWPSLHSLLRRCWFFLAALRFFILDIMTRNFTVSLHSHRSRQTQFHCNPYDTYPTWLPDTPMHIAS